MALSRNRKRQRDEDNSHIRPSLKKCKTNVLHRPPEVYDQLSRVWLTRDALEEHNRRNALQPAAAPTIEPSSTRSAKLRALKKLGVAPSACCAVNGGPDLRDLRGYPRPAGAVDAMESLPSTTPSSSKSCSTHPTTVTSRSTSRSSAYNANFEQILIDHNIFPPLHEFPGNCRAPKPANLGDIQKAIAVPRGSLSPSVVPESAFENFQRQNKTKSEGTTMRNVIPLIAGTASIPNDGHLPFNNLDSLTENLAVNPVPDFFDGASPSSLAKQVREDLDKIIVPNKTAGVPIAPNFFLEVKGPKGNPDVAVAQAVLDGAHGAASMHALQNYRRETIIYDGNAYAFSSTYSAGTLTIYAHHTTKPTSPGERPSYHMTPIAAHVLTIENSSWLEGTRKFRCLRELAQRYLGEFISSANARAHDLPAMADATAGADEVLTVADDQTSEEGGSSPTDFFECEWFVEPGQGDVENETGATQESIGLGIHHQQSDDHSQRLLDTQASTSFVGSSAATSTSEATSGPSTPPLRGSKLLLHSPPSPSAKRNLKKR